jgi:hypothetical protein
MVKASVGGVFAGHLNDLDWPITAGPLLKLKCKKPPFARAALHDVSRSGDSE